MPGQTDPGSVYQQFDGCLKVAWREEQCCWEGGAMLLGEGGPMLVGGRSNSIVIKVYTPNLKAIPHKVD